MDGTKKWYKSTTIWAGIYAALRGIYGIVQTVLAPMFGWHLPNIPPIVDSIIGSIVGGAVIEGRSTATEKIG